jgi:N-acetylneuraminate synthase
LNEIRIGSKLVGPGHPAYIVAEIGQNHGGNVNKAMSIMSMAKGAGADAVKFQKRVPHLAVPKSELNKIRETPWGRMSYLNYRNHLELTHSNFDSITDHADDLDIDFFTSVWDEPSLDFIMDFEPIAIKVPSPCLTDIPLLEAIAATESPVILSTGMSTRRQILEALSVFHRSAPKCDLIVCQCTSTYPCPPEEVNLGVVRDSDQSKFLVGYSGHELGVNISIAAVALGACYIERHFTDDKTQWGSDQAMSLEPCEFRQMVDGIREVEAAMGDGKKQLYDSELDAMKRLRRVT